MTILDLYVTINKLIKSGVDLNEEIFMENVDEGYDNIKELSKQVEKYDNGKTETFYVLKKDYGFKH